MKYSRLIFVVALVGVVLSLLLGWACGWYFQSKKINPYSLSSNTVKAELDMEVVEDIYAEYFPYVDLAERQAVPVYLSREQYQKPMNYELNGKHVTPVSYSILYNDQDQVVGINIGLNEPEDEFAVAEWSFFVSHAFLKAISFVELNSPWVSLEEKQRISEVYWAEVLNNMIHESDQKPIRVL